MNKENLNTNIIGSFIQEQYLVVGEETVGQKSTIKKSISQDLLKARITHLQSNFSGKTLSRQKKLKFTNGAPMTTTPK